MIPNTAIRVSLEAVEALRHEIAPYFIVSDTSLDVPEAGYFRFRGRPQGELEDHYELLRPLFERYGFTPLVRQENNHIALIGLPVVIKPQPIRWRTNVLLFLGTVCTTLLVGAMNEEAFSVIVNQATVTGDWAEVLRGLHLGLPYCLSILAILLAHEFGHFFAALYHQVSASLPYFIPLPPFLSPFGTLGAFIMQREPSKNVKVQFDIGAAGPLAGLIVAIPILIYGLYTSPVGPLPEGGYLMEGNSILYMAMKYVIFGEFLPTAVRDVSLNQMAWAGWTGLFITGINLLPVGQLDGGRVVQVLFGRKILEQLYWPILLGLAIFSLLAQTPIWFLMIVLLFMFGRQYEEPLDAVTPLDPTRRALAIMTFVLFFLIFVPIPLEVVLP